MITIGSSLGHCQATADVFMALAVNFTESSTENFIENSTENSTRTSQSNDANYDHKLENFSYYEVRRFSGTEESLTRKRISMIAIIVIIIGN